MVAGGFGMGVLLAAACLIRLDAPMAAETRTPINGPSAPGAAPGPVNSPASSIPASAPDALSGTASSPASAGALSGTASALSATAGAAPDALSKSAAAEPRDLQLLPGRPPLPKLERPAAWEYFTVVTLLSAPFSGLWTGLAAVIIEGIAQGGKLPPKINSTGYLVIGAVAGATSVGIGIFSLSWGNAGKPAAPAPSKPPLPAKLKAAHD